MGETRYCKWSDRVGSAANIGLNKKVVEDARAQCMLDVATTKPFTQAKVDGSQVRTESERCTEMQEQQDGY